MRLSDATKALFSEGVLGNTVLQDLSLPAESFPDAGSWNQFPDLSDDDATRLRTSAFASPPRLKKNSTPLDATTVANKKKTFISLNAASVRYSPTHRVWPKEDVYAAQQRLVYGCSLMVMRIHRGATGWSDPFMVVTGPMAVAPNGDLTLTRDIFGLAPDAPLPSIVDGFQFPEILSPTTVSLLPDPRAWVPTLTSHSALDNLRTSGACLTIVDSSKLCNMVIVYDAGETSATLFDDIDLGLFAPVDPTKPGCFNDDTMLAWFMDSPAPPDPRTTNLWTPRGFKAKNVAVDEVAPVLPILDEAIQQTVTYAPCPNEKQAFRLHRHMEASDMAGHVLVGACVHFPLGVAAPVGLSWKPGDLSIDQFQAVLLDLTDGDPGSAAWLDNPVFQTWFEAASNSPDAFCVDAFTHSTLVKLFPETGPPQGLSLRLHQEWAILAQFLWDHAFAAAVAGTSKDNTATLLRKYAEALLVANNDGGQATALHHEWGFAESVYRLPFLARLRPLMHQPLVEQNKLCILYQAVATDLPTYVSHLLPIQVASSSRNNPVLIPPLLSVADTPVDADDSVTTDHQAGTVPIASLITAPTTPQNNVFKRLASNPAHPQPPAKRSLLLTAAPAPVPATPNPTVSFQFPGVGTLTGLPSTAPTQPVVTLPRFDPHAVRASLVANIALSEDAQWLLPFTLKGQSPLPTPPPPPPGQLKVRSAALQTAIRQSKAAAAAGKTIINNEVVTFEFSRELMFSSCTSRLSVARYSFLLSYRMALSTDPAPVTLLPPSQQYDSDYFFAPGQIQPDLALLFKAAHQKLEKHTSVGALAQWFKDQVGRAQASEDDAEVECRLVQSFFTTEVIMALQACNFHSGYQCDTNEEPKHLITPWSFLKSIEAFASAKSCRIPVGGCTATQLADIITNIVWLLHTMCNDFRDADHIKFGHSPFSRFSPLAGHLMSLIAQLRHSRMVEAWASAKITGSKRERLTLAVFIAVAELFKLYTQWMDPRQVPRDTYLTARIKQDLDLTLLTPAIDSDFKRKSPILEKWRAQIAYFQHSQIHLEMPREGFFSQETPLCYQPRSDSNSGGSSSANAARSTTRNRSSDSRNDRSADSRNDRSSGQSGESSRRESRKARTCMMSRVASGSTKEIQAIMNEINRGKSGSDVIRPPMCQLIGEQARKPLCFRFISVDGGGCTSHNCTFQHIDLQDASWIRRNVPEAFMRDFLAFLEKREVAIHIRPTPCFRRFLDRR